jgi:hypothetical protein
MLAFQLLACYYVILKIKGCFIFLPLWVVGQQLTLTDCTMLWTLILSTCKLLGQDDWEPNKLQARLQSKENPTSLKLLPPSELSQYLLGWAI